ncbi:hypothetical protein NFI96_017932, partial [Prochilodus magdalenae]
MSCDMKVMRLMRERSLGNSTTMLYHKLREQHSEAWMTRTLQYLAVCNKFQVPGVEVQHVAPPPPMVPVPSPDWLLTIHAEDVRTRIGEMKARVTSIFGSILKIDSTKKVVKKLAGAAAGTAVWVTNVGNEDGQVLMSMLTSHEGGGLLHMAAGLMARYREAGIPPPKLLYVDRDCCSGKGRSRAAAMFHKWDKMVVRLDVWHLMRRFAVGVTKDSHQFYGLFMAKLSSCIFEWDAADVATLWEAVRAEMEEKQGILGLTEEQLNNKLTPELLARHCRRCTRGAQLTEELIGQLLAAFRGVTDTMGIPLLDNERMDAIWNTQQQHLWELIGVEYLYSQQCKELRDDIGRDPDTPDSDPDYEPEWEYEGCDEVRYLGEESDPTIAPLSVADPHHELLVVHVKAEAHPSPASSIDTPNDPVPLPSVGGYDHVVRLARYLVELRDEPSISERRIADIVALWNHLTEADLTGSGSSPSHRERLLEGRHKNFQKKQELAVLSMETPVPNPRLAAAIPLSEPRQHVPEPEHPRPFVFPSSLDLSGQAVRQVSHPVPASATASIPFAVLQAPPLDHPAPALLPQPAPLPKMTTSPPQPQPTQPTPLQPGLERK